MRRVAVEQRSVSGTLMNDTSSRTHYCITILKLCWLDIDSHDVCISRLQLFDMMGSERSKGQNSAHDQTKNNKDYITNGMGGVEGIYANMSLMNMRHLINQIVETTNKAKKMGKLRADMSHLDSVARKGIYLECHGLPALVPLWPCPYNHVFDSLSGTQKWR